jgi:predicted HTH domain antitoxin
MTINIPDDILHRAGLTEREVLIELACRLFDAERLGKGLAARMCGLERIEFEEELRKRKLAVYHTSLEDYEREMGAERGRRAG